MENFGKSKLKANIFRFGIIIVMLILFILTFYACNRNRKLVTFDTSALSGIAEVTFDKDEYYVGDTVSFSVVIDDKYSNSNYNIFVNDNLVDKVNGKYSYNLNSESIKITISNYELNVYTFNLLNNDFSIIADATRIVHGTSFEFDLTTDKYLNDYKVLVNSVEVIKSNGKYIIENVTGNLNIEVTNLHIKTFNINTILCTGCSIEFDNNINNLVKYGEDVSFIISLNTGYEKSSNFKVLVNSNEMFENNSKYTIKNVTANITIVVTGVELKSNSITFVNANGLNIIGNNSVVYDNNYSFSFTLKDGYVLENDFDILVNNTSVYEIDKFEYTINNVTSDLVIEFVGISRLEYLISYDIEEGLTLNIDTTKVYYNDTLTFKVLPLPGYYIDYDMLLVMFSDGTEDIELFRNDNNEYVIENIKSNISISVYGAMLKECIFASIADEIEINLEDGQNVSEAIYTVFDEIYFSIQVKDCYKKLDNFKLLTNTGNLSYDNELDLYCLTNVTDNIELSVENVEYIGYTFNYTDTSDYTIEVVSTNEVYNSGDYFEFKVILIDDNLNVKVYINDEECSAVSGIYSILITNEMSYINNITIEIL